MREPGNSFRWSAIRWTLPTLSSRPLTSPSAISSEVTELVLAARAKLNRCAEVVWHYLVSKLAITISLSSVKRIFRRHHIYDRFGLHGRKRPRPYHRSLPRPVVLAPGGLVQTDTIHLVNLTTHKRLYVYTVIDLYSRMAYAEVHSKLSPGLASRVVLNARAMFGFGFAMVQADNGSEYSSYFESRLHGQGILTRHSRLHRPNDNAHIERFNRTIQEECTSPYYKLNQSIGSLQTKIDKYLDYYNHERVHLGIQLRTPYKMLQRS